MKTPRHEASFRRLAKLRREGLPCPGYWVSHRFYGRLYWAMPPWITDSMANAIVELYERRRTGEGVDHIVPLDGRNVCGLNVPWNLRIITRKENGIKSNRVWPDCPHENLELFCKSIEPQQLKLEV